MNQSLVNMSEGFSLVGRVFSFQLFEVGPPVCGVVSIDLRNSATFFCQRLFVQCKTMEVELLLNVNEVTIGLNVCFVSRSALV